MFHINSGATGFLKNVKNMLYSQGHPHTEKNLKHSGQALALSSSL